MAILAITVLAGSLAREATPIAPAGENASLVGAWSEPIEFGVEAIHADRKSVV